MYKMFTGALFRQYVVVFAINLNCIGFGLGLNWLSPVLVKLANVTETVLSRPLEQEEGSWIASVYFLIAGIGYVTTFALIDYIGRKHCVLVSSSIRMASALFLLFSTEVWMVMLGRAVIGLSDGMILGAVPVYTSEIASKEVRGALGVMMNIFTAIGTIIMLSVGPFISYFELNLMLISFVFATSIPTIFLPDSPSFLYSRGRHEDSKRVLMFLRESEHLANEELKEYCTNKNDEKLCLLTIFKKKLFQTSLGMSGFLIVFFHLVGFNCVMMYLQTILDATKTSIRSEVASGIIGAINLVASFSTLMTTDRFGRKPILVVTVIGMGAGMVGLGTFFKITEKGTDFCGFLNFLPLISLIIVVFCFSGGLGSLVWVLIAELFDDRSRGVGVATSLLISTIPSFVALRYFSPLMHAIGPAGTFWTFAVLCVVLACFVAFRVPETKGKSFAEIQHALGYTVK